MTRSRAYLLITEDRMTRSRVYLLITEDRMTRSRVYLSMLHPFNNSNIIHKQLFPDIGPRNITYSGGGGWNAIRYHILDPLKN